MARVRNGPARHQRRHAPVRGVGRAHPPFRVAGDAQRRLRRARPEVALKNLRAAIEGAKAMGFAGLNLTVPHKLLAVEMMDALDESAETWGAVNTIRFESSAGVPPANLAKR